MVIMQHYCIIKLFNPPTLLTLSVKDSSRVFICLHHLYVPNVSAQLGQCQ